MATLTPTAGGIAPPLLRMPAEILQQIASHLTTPDYGRFRMSCKHLEVSFFNAFTREFFMKKQFMITPFSLQALIDMSESRMADAMRHVIFGLESPMAFFDYYHVAHNIQTPLQKYNLTAHLGQHTALLDCAYDIEMMSQAFAKLKNLEIVEIRDFRSYRTRDQTRWKSYGVTTFEEETGRRMTYQTTHSDMDKARVARSFQNILRGLGKTDTRPKRFEVNTRGSGLLDMAFEIQRYDEPRFIPLLASLEALHLDLGPGSGRSPILVADEDNGHHECVAYYLRKFLPHVHNLRVLRVNFPHLGTTAEGFLTWFQAIQPIELPGTDSDDPGGLPRAPPPMYFKKLQQLEIGKVDLRPELLLGLFKKYRNTLKTLVLHRVGLKHGNPKGSKVNHWTKFFSRMAELDLNITTLTMSHLGQIRENAPAHEFISFKDSNPSKVRSWGGEDLGGALKDFVNNMEVEWRSEADSPNSDSSDSEESTDEVTEDSDEENAMDLAEAE